MEKKMMVQFKLLYVGAFVAIVIGVGGCYTQSDPIADDMEITAAQCQDNMDNDGDGFTDCDDEECQGFNFCTDGATHDSQCTARLDDDDTGKQEEIHDLCEHGACTIKIASTIPISGVCKKVTDACEGGFSSSLSPEMSAIHNCIEGYDCCADTDQCEGLKDAIEPALGLTSSCTPKSGDDACTQELGLHHFSVGCGKDKPVCCLVPVDMPDAG